MDELLTDLTPRQKDVLLEIVRLEQEEQVITTASLGAHLGMARQNVRLYLLALNEAGLILYAAADRQNASIRLSSLGRRLLELDSSSQGDVYTLRLPIVGEVAAGKPIVAQEYLEGYATRISDLLDLKEGDFLLHIRGESMTGIGIYSGDYVIIRPLQDEPHSGEIALVLLPGDSSGTLKRWKRHNGTVTLSSENSLNPPMTYATSEVVVQGCLVGIIGSGRARRNGSGGG